MRDWDALMKKIDDMSIEELEQTMRAALDESECTKHLTVEEGFEALRQFVDYVVERIMELKDEK